MPRKFGPFSFEIVTPIQALTGMSFYSMCTESLELRRLYNDITMVYKIVHKLTSLNDDVLLSYHNANNNYHVLTREHTLKLKRKAFRLYVARNHFCNRVVSVWNGLPEHVVTAASLTLFKKYLRTIDFSSYIKFDRNL